MDLWQQLRPNDDVTIVKRSLISRKEPTIYPARMIPSDHPGWFAFEAFWSFPDAVIDGLQYETGGRFIEYFASDRMFNIFRMHSRSGVVSGYYANVTQYPLLTRNDKGDFVLTWIDLWLDVVRYPSGQLMVLDEDEFARSDIAERDPALALSIRQACQEARDTLNSPEWWP